MCLRKRGWLPFVLSSSGLLVRASRSEAGRLSEFLCTCAHTRLCGCTHIVCVCVSVDTCDLAPGQMLSCARSRTHSLSSQPYSSPHPSVAEATFPGRGCTVTSDQRYDQKQIRIPNVHLLSRAHARIHTHRARALTAPFCLHLTVCDTACLHETLGAEAAFPEFSPVAAAQFAIQQRVH